MKPQILNRVLLAGVFSSLVFLVNCNSDSARSVKAAMPVKKLDTSTLPPCTGDIMTHINDRLKIVDDLNKKMKEFEGQDLTAAQKTILNNLAENLKSKYNDVYKAVHALKGSPAGCNSVNAQNQKTPHVLERMRLENLRLGNEVKKLTGQTNLLLSSDDTNETSLLEQQSYTFKEELSKLMIKSKVDSLHVVAGKVREGSLDDIRKLGENPANEYCYLNSSSEEATSSEVFNVLKTSFKPSDDEKTVIARIIFVAEGGQLNAFICSVKPGADIPKKLRTVFGDLLKLKNGTASQRDVEVGD